MRAPAPADRAPRPCYAFRQFELDIAGRELRENGTSVELPASAFDCLVYLIRHRDRAIGRDELISATWGCIDTSDTTLAHTIVRLRRLFGDAGKEQHTIRTIPRVGYRWVAPTGECAAPASKAPLDAACEPTPRSTHAPIRNRVLPRVVLIAAAAVLVAVCGLLWPGRRVDAERAAPPSIVLPAGTDALAPEWAWLRFAVADLVAARLTRSRYAAIASERVAASAAHSGDARTAATDAAQIRPDLRRVDDEWRVTLRTRDAHGRPLVSEGRGSDAMDAARRATDAFLHAMGYTAPTAETDALASHADLNAAIDAGLDDALAEAMAAAAGERFDEAADRLGEARALSEHGTDGGAKIDAAFGALLVRRQQPAMALPYLHRAIARLDQQHGTAVLVDALTSVAEAQLALRANEAALIATSRAWSLTGAHDTVSVAAALHARALAACGDTDGANRLVAGLHARTPLDRARLQALRARLALDADAIDTAVDAATQALTVDYARADRLAYARAWVDKIEALQRAGRSGESATELQRLTTWCGTTCTSTHALRLALQAGQAIAEQRGKDALALYANALRAADRTATPAVQTTIAAAYLETLVAAGRMDIAVAVAGRLPERDLAGLPPRTRAAADAVRAWQEQFIEGPGLARTGETRRARRNGLVR